MKIKLTVAAVINDGFAQAFGVLCADTTLPVKERYAIGRAMLDIRQHMELYEAERIKLIRALGMPRERYLELLRKRAEGADPERRAALDAKARGALDFIVDDEDEAAIAEFGRKLRELKVFEFEVFLDHKVKLADSVRLSAADLMALDALVEAE